MTGETSLQQFEAAVASFQPGQSAVEQPLEPVAPPPPVERKQPFGNWNVRWEKFQQNLGEFGPAVKENFINIVKSGGRKRWSRDFWTVANAALLEIPVVGPIASLTSVLTQTGLLVGKEVKKAKSLGKEKYLGQSALIQAGEAMFKTTFKREGKETAAGKRERAGGQTEDLVLTNTEAAIAGVFGVGSSLAAIAILEDISLINFIPGMKAAKRLYLAPLLTMLISSGFGALGESYFDVFKRSDKVKDEKLFQQKKAQFVEMVLAVNAPVMQIMTTMGIITSLAEKAGEYVAAHPKDEAPPPTLVPTFEHTPEPTAPPSTPTQPPVITQEVTPTLEPSITPTAELSWQPGEVVDKALLQNAADHNYGWGIDVDGDGHADFQAFWLDQQNGPDVIVDAERHQFIRGENDLFYLDADKNGLIQGNEAHGAWNLESFNPQLEPLVDVPQADVPNFHNLIDISAEDIAKAGKPGLASPVAFGTEAQPIPPILDLNEDGKMDINIDDKGQFADNNYDGVFTEKVDTRISEPIEFDMDNWQINKIVYEDGSMWLRNDDGELVGILPDGRDIRLDDSSGTSRLQVQMHQENLAWSPWQVGRMAVINPDNEPIPPAPIVTPPPVEPMPEVVIETDHGKWVESGDNVRGFKANGDEVWLDPQRGGVHGVLQLEMHHTNPDLDPEAVTIVAHRVIVDNKDEIEAFRRPVGDGNAVTAAAGTPAVIQLINQQTAILSVERFLESNQGWLKNNGIDWRTLSVKERLEVGREFLAQNTPIRPQTVTIGVAGSDFLKAFFGWDNDDEIKSRLLTIIPEIEEKYD